MRNSCYAAWGFTPMLRNMSEKLKIKNWKQ